MNNFFYFSNTFTQLRRTSFGRIDEKPDKEDTGTTYDISKTAVIFSLKNEVGCLVKALRLFQVSNHFTSSEWGVKIEMCQRR